MSLVDQYSKMHNKERRFPGFSIKPYVGEIAALVDEIQPERILDYGSGKGYQYLAKRVHEQWGGILPYCYDPGVMYLREIPEGVFQGVICTDVLEHIEEDNIPATLNEIFSRVDDGPAFVFLAICCRPARRKLLADGRNVHVTVKPPEWWEKRLQQHERGDGLIIRTAYDEA